MKNADVVLFYHDTSEQSVSNLREYLATVRVVKPSDNLIRETISTLPRGKGLTSQLVLQSPLLSAAYKPALARYFWVMNYCKRVDISTYDNILLCDSRDVVVQTDVFDKIKDATLVCGAEELRIRECTINQWLISNCYGQDVLKSLSDELIICSGVSLGSRQIVVEYVYSMVQELKQMGRRIGFHRLNIGEDQAVHNYLIRTNALNFSVHASRSDDGVIATLGYYDTNHIIIDTDSGNILLSNGITPSIVHQYDRFPELRRHYSVTY
jgi:hypothetical protein